jgi:hypothetical protein
VLYEQCNCTPQLFIKYYIDEDVSNCYILCYIVLLGRLLKCYRNLIQVGGAVAKADSRLLPTEAAWVRARVRSCGICGGQSGTGAGFLRVLWFSLPRISPSAPHYS